MRYRTVEYEAQRRPYAGQGYPEPGEDPELASIIQEVLSTWLRETPPDKVMQELARRIYAYVTQENKRKNLVGEGFEDVIAAVLGQLPFASELTIRTRSLLNELGGFHPPRPSEKAKRVDLAIVKKDRRILVSAKWSIRADREEQFQSDFETYSRIESAGRTFDYVLVTNEFDAARLKAACERRRENALLFSSVVHINPQGVLAAYGGTGRGAARDILGHVETGRLMSLQNWLGFLETGTIPTGQFGGLSG